MKPRIPITAAALYWLLVVCGLVGTTILRRNHLEQLAPLWIGTVGGVVIGQLASVLRIRPLLPILIVIGSSWLLLPFTFYLVEASGMSSNGGMLLALALVPSVIGGYLSLSERGGIVAFWYPAVLWMIVILEHPLDARQTAFHPQAALPFLVLLGALFVAFLRARETRRVTIWEGHGSPRLARNASRTVLRASPLRSAFSVAWTGAVGGVALLLTWWVAPQLWQKDVQLQREDRAMTARATSTELPCCESRNRRTRVQEYLPLSSSFDESSLSCRSCSVSEPVASIENRPLYGTPTYSGGWGSGGSSEPTTVDTTPVGNPYAVTTGQTTTSTVTPSTPVPAVVTPAAPLTPTPVVSPVAAPVVAAPKHVAPSPVAIAPKPKKTHVDPTVTSTPGDTTGSTTSFDGSASAAPYGYVPPSQPVTSPFPASAPWPWLLVAAFAGVLGHVLLRVLRRTVTLAHLARPFWNEPVDQRISNHWERMLIGLRDAGIQEGRDESPSAFARRVGIAGMESCAMILERVRHGVRIEEHDLENMAAGASAVFATARNRAGLPGRVAAWIR